MLENKQALAAIPFASKRLLHATDLDISAQPGRVVSDPASPAQVASALLAYLAQRLRMKNLRYAVPPCEFPDGWETYTYRFQLEQTTGLPPVFAQPLIVRIYGCPKGLPQARHEFHVQQYLSDLEYPVPQPVLLEECLEFFGGPFAIRAHVAGQTLLQQMQQHNWSFFPAPVWMVKAQARLHRLPTAGLRVLPGEFLGRSLDLLAEQVDGYELDGMAPGLAWLVAHRPAPPVKPSIIHLDFHPINLIYAPNSPLVLLDWPQADVGDRHADVATSAMLMECVPAGSVTAQESMLMRIGRFLIVRWYLRTYRLLVGLDRNTLAYYRAWAAFRRLCLYGSWLRASPLVTAYKPSSLEYLSSHHIHTLLNYFRKWTDTRIRL
jgi:aminoglycoside phosphotransferase (APT) family kinase protein